MDEAVKAEAHRQDADEAACDMTANVLRLERVAQLPAKSKIAEDRHHGEGGSVEGDLAGGDLASRRLDQGRHTNENDDRKDLEQDPLHRVFDFGIHGKRFSSLNGQGPQRQQFGRFG
ncbi:hypothetical protein D3C80_1716100 [compost metagenome]